MNELGPWAVIAGASEGLGAAFAQALAARGVNLVLVARRSAELAALATSLPVQTRCLALDLASDFAAPLAEACADLEVGLAIYNAAFAPEGAFISQSLAEVQRAVTVNCLAPVTFAHVFAGSMCRRGRGGLVFMSSLAGFQGSPGIAVYGATKAFNLVLGEALWGELAHAGVQVVACCAGAVRTPNYERSGRRPAPGILEPREVAEQTLAALGRGPLVIPGRFNRFASWIMRRMLPRRWAIRIMAGQNAKKG
jgi:short-subunit dehydrogenase